MTWGVYAHVPWCRGRCPYCAFDIVPRETPDAARWTAGVLADLARWRPAFPGRPTTLYIGGGTPSRLPAEALATLVRAVDAPHTTVEANPEDLTDAWLDALVAAGVTRISLGVQSTVPRFARTLGRAHVAPGPAIERVRDRPLDSWSVDLIFGVPGQTLADLEADLEALLAWEPPHVALYGLTIEPGTAYARLAARGRTMEVDDDVWRAMYDHLVARLEAAGLSRYEVSNFARPGHRSAHNALYWTGRPYLAVGPGAHGLAPDGRRWTNASWTAWRDGAAPDVEQPSPEQAALDALVSGLRGAEGIDVAALGSYRVDPVVVHRLQEARLLTRDPTRLTLTHAGFPMADAVTRALADALRPATG
jgi:oxygen-independent coproporphyrinogen-3 oxidase